MQTLLDVVAGRKNQGVLEGTITLNGHKEDKTTFARLTAYVEQTDIHAPYATVREALNFSARLRLPASVTSAQRSAFIQEVLEILELEDIADRLIGLIGSPDGLAPGQRKR